MHWPMRERSRNFAVTCSALADREMVLQGMDFDLRLLRRTACRECGCKLLSALLSHRARRLRAHARDQGFELSGTHGVGVDAERVEFSSEEGLRSGPEIALGYTEQLLRKRVQSSPVVASSDNA